MTTPNTPHYYLSPDKSTDIAVFCEVLPFWRGNALKYMYRAGRKTQDELPDLEKALDCIQREILRVKAERARAMKESV